jgi:hypothetical protein
MPAELRSGFAPNAILSLAMAIYVYLNLGAVRGR